MKSPVISLLTQPLTRIEALWRAEYESAISGYQQQQSNKKRWNYGGRRGRLITQYAPHPWLRPGSAGLVKVGLPPKVLVAKIDRSPGNFDTSPDVLGQLKVAGVHDSIILAMVCAS
jgi:hypothetical protein